MGKLIVLEGTDCSGKETQTNLLCEKLNIEMNVINFSFPMYDTATGKIIGGPYLGQKLISECYFEEGATSVNPKVASLYYAADRLYNIDKIKEGLNNNDIVLLNRYVESNMGHQGGKIYNQNDRFDMYEWLNKLEYDLLELPKPDLIIFLYMPYEYSSILKKNRLELDQHEIDEEHLINAEKAYLELANKFNYKIVNCVRDGIIRPKEDINNEVYNIVKEYINSK